MTPLAFRFVPFIRILLPLITGIIIAEYLPLPHIIEKGCIAMGSMLMIYIVMVQVGKSRGKIFQGLLIQSMLLTAGFCLHQHYGFRPDPPDISDAVYTVCRVTSPASIKKTYYKLEVMVESAFLQDTVIHPQKKAYLELLADSFPAIPEPGDLIIVKRGFYEPRDAMNPYTFSQKRYLRSMNIYYTGRVFRHDQISLSGHIPLPAFKRFLNYLRTSLISVFDRSSLDSEERGIAQALVFGFRDGLERDVKKAYSNTGSIHILAVSGLHVGLIYAMLNALFFFLRRKRWKLLLKFLLVVLFLWLYTFIAGLSPSVLRATIMFTMFQLGQLFSRKSNSYNTLAATAVILMLTDTTSLFDIGFQLSFLAVGGILFFYPYMSKWVKSRYKAVNYVWNMCAVTLAAQLSTFPLCLYYFHQFPNYFLVANLIVVPLSSLVLGGGILYILICWIPWLNEVIAWPLNYLLKGMTWYIRWLDQLPGSVWGGFTPGKWETLLLYTGIITLSIYFISRRNRWIFGSLISLLLLLCITLTKRWENINRREAWIYYSRTGTAIDYIHHGKSLLYCFNDYKGKDYEAKHLFSGVKEVNYRYTTTNGIFMLGNRIMAYISDNETLYSWKSRMKTDVLIIGKCKRIDMSVLVEWIEPSVIIFTAENSRSKVSKWEKECVGLGITCINQHETGAYQYPL